MVELSKGASRGRDQLDPVFHHSPELLLSSSAAAQLLLQFLPLYPGAFLGQCLPSNIQVHFVLERFKEVKILDGNDCGDILSVPVQPYPFTPKRDFVENRRKLFPGLTRRNS